MAVPHRLPDRRAGGVGEGATVDRSLLAPGVLVAGTVRNSVLGRNVRVERGATVSDSVVLDDAVIRDGAVIDRAIVDGGVTVDAAPTPTIDEPSGIAVYGGTDDGSAED